MQPIPGETIVQHLNWRYATKKFDPSRPIDPGTWRTLREALILAPSSFGLQPWRFYDVTSPEVRARLRPAAFGQAQITDAAHLVVFAAKTGLAPEDVERFIARVAEVRGLPPEALADYKGRILGHIARPAEQVDAWVSRQVYIALGTFLTAAALLGVDACPMEGFNPAAFDEVLGLPAQGYTSVVLAAAGHRAEDDGFARLAKVRFPAEHVIVTV